MAKPKISIITVVLNKAQTLERTLKSVISQGYPKNEYIVIDGGSTDGSLDIIKRYQDKIAYWTSEPDKGLYEAMNKGIRRVSGDWVIMLNSDDYYVDNKAIERAANRLDSRGKKFYYFTMLHKYPNGDKKIYKKPIYWWNRWKLYYSAYIPHMALFVAKKQYEDVGFYDSRFRIAADHDLILRLVKAGYKPVFVDIPLTVMTIGGVSSKNEELTFREFRDITIKNGLNPLLANLIFKFKLWKHKKRH